MNHQRADWRIAPVAASDRDLVRALRGAGLPVADLAACGASFICGRSGGQPIGYGGLEIHGRLCLLRSLVVLPGHRGCGYGRRMAAEILDIAGARGVHEVYLLTTTAPDFFASLGFAPVARAQVARQIRATTEFADLCPEDAVVMRRILSGRATG